MMVVFLKLRKRFFRLSQAKLIPASLCDLNAATLFLLRHSRRQRRSDGVLSSSPSILSPAAAGNAAEATDADDLAAQRQFFSHIRNISGHLGINTT